MNPTTFGIIIPAVITIIGYFLAFTRFNDTIKKEIDQLKFAHKLSLQKYYLDKRIEKYQTGLKLLNGLLKASFQESGFGYIDFDGHAFMSDFEDWYNDEANSVLSVEADNEISFLILQYEIHQHSEDHIEGDLFNLLANKAGKIYSLLKSDIKEPLDVLDKGIAIK